MLCCSQSVDGNGFFQASDRDLFSGIKLELEVIWDCVAYGARYHDGHRLRMSAQPRGEVDCGSNDGIIEMLRRAYVSDHNAAGVDANAELADSLLSRAITLAGALHNSKRAQTTLTHVVFAVKNGHHSIAGELVDVTAELVNELDLFSEAGTQEREQLFRFHVIGKRRESEDVGEQHNYH